MLLLAWLLPVSGIILRFIGDVCINGSFLYIAEEDSITQGATIGGGHWVVASVWLVQ